MDATDELGDSFFCMKKRLLLMNLFLQSLTAMTSRKNENRRNKLSSIFFSRRSIHGDTCLRLLDCIQEHGSYTTGRKTANTVAMTPRQWSHALHAFMPSN